MESGILEGFRKGYLRTYFRQAGHIVLVNRLFRVYGELNREAVERRKVDL